MENSQKLAIQLWSIGDEVRLRILSVLPVRECCEHRANVTTLSERLSIPQPTISHHLRILRQAGIVKKSKLCRDCYYYIDLEEGKEILERLKETLRVDSAESANDNS